MSSSSSSSLFAEMDFDVFLSCNCELNLANDLLYGLNMKGIKCFISESCKEMNLEPIDQPTLKALSESKVVVVMLSEKQRSSPGFLEELVVILDFQEQSSLTVLPVFLTEQRLDMEEIFNLFPERAEIWRAAMIKLEDMSTQFSFTRQPNWTSELDHITKLADDIWFILLSTPSIDFYSLVGMDRQMKAFHELLALESDKEVRTIGIFGKAGVGKTTLARYIFQEISVSFQTHVFIDNVENMKDKLLLEKNEREELKSLDHERYEMNEAKKKHRKTLLIADGVDNIEQGNWVVEYGTWFGPGSRVILVSENQDLLIQAGINHVYEVRTLRYDEALKLFSYFAFKDSYPPSDFERVAVRAVQLAGFLPLTLRLFGSFLTGKSLKEWEDILLELNSTKGKEVMEVLKLMEASEDK